MVRAPLRQALLVCVIFLCASLASLRPHPWPHHSSSLSSLSPSFSTIRSANEFSMDPTTGIMTFTPGNSTTHDLGARQISPFTAAGILVDAMKLVDKLIKILDGDKSARGEHTKSLVTGVCTCYPYFNVVVCHGQHDFKWDGVEGKGWLHQHKEFDTKAGGAVGYEMYITRSGTFRNHGDGGYLNWVYGSNIITMGVDGANVQFGPYATPRGKLSTAK